MTAFGFQQLILFLHDNSEGVLNKILRLFFGIADPPRISFQIVVVFEIKRGNKICRVIQDILRGWHKEKTIKAKTKRESLKTL